MTAASLQLIDYEDERNELATLDDRLNDVLDNLEGDIVPEERSLLEDDVLEMLQTQRNYLDAIIVDTNSYLDKLIDLNSRSGELIAQTGEYAEFCDERILWIRSASTLSAFHLRDFSTSLRWLASPQNWLAAGRTLASELASHPGSTGFAALIWLGCLACQRRWRRSLAQQGEQAARGSCRTFVPTLRSLLLTALLVLLWPIPLALVGLRLAEAVSPTEFARSL